MKKQNLHATTSIRLSINTGMLEYGHADRMATQNFYKAYAGSRLLLLDSEYEFGLAIYSLERSDTYIYTYAYQENECWAVYNGLVKPNIYYQSSYLFDKECYFRVNLRRKDNKEIDKAEAAHINDILRYEIPDNILEDNHRYPIGYQNIFSNEMENTIKKVTAEYKQEGINSFLLLTDSHYVVNGTWENTIALLREVNRRAPINGIIHLGDITDGMVSRKVCYDYVNFVKQDLFLLDKPLYITIGNHDSNYFRGNPECFSKEEQYWLYQSDCCNGAVRKGHALYYYCDFKEIFVRAVFLDSFDASNKVRYGFADEEALWLQDILKTVPENYRILVFSHVPPLAEIHYWSKEIRNGEKMVEILEQYMQSDAKHCVMGWIHGHNHADQIYRERLFPIISLGCTKVEDFKDKKPDNAITYDRRIGEVSQELWNILMIRRDSSQIKFIRFGAGEDMET